MFGNIKATFALRLKEAREIQGYSQKELSSMLNVSQSTVASWETQKREPTLDTLFDVAKKLNTSLDYLLGLSNKSTIYSFQEPPKMQNSTNFLSIGESIKRIRISKNFSQKKLADLLKIGQASVSAWERGAKIPLCTNVIEMAKVFQTTTDYILGISEKPNNVSTSEKSTLENEILNAYQALSEREQVMICRMLNLEHPAEKLAKIKKA